MHGVTSTLKVWQQLERWLGGKWLFSRLLCLKAPYFSGIRPRIEALRPEYCRARIAKRRAVLNHIGTVHAIAMCNMAELTGGAMTEVTVPATHRWIPKGMTVEYLQKATTDLVAVATPESTPDWSAAGEYKVRVAVTDRKDVLVFQALITMWVTPNKASA